MMLDIVINLNGPTRSWEPPIFFYQTQTDGEVFNWTIIGF